MGKQGGGVLALLPRPLTQTMVESASPPPCAEGLSPMLPPMHQCMGGSGGPASMVYTTSMPWSSLSVTTA